MRIKYSQSSLSGLGKKDRERLSLLIKNTKGSISVRDATTILEYDRKEVAKFLSRLAKKGWLSRVKRGLFVQGPLWSETPDIPLFSTFI